MSTQSTSRPWATDTPISRPEPVDPNLPILVDFGGIGMSAGGLTPTLSRGDVEDVFFPFFAPEGFRG